MQLGKLLFAGKSIVNGREKISYRQNKLVALPKFISRKNPFIPAKAPADTAVLPAKNEAEPVPSAASREQPQISSAPKPRASWTAKLNPISLWAGAAPAPQKQLPAVQAELSLDTVKVVHNDLTDADVEVVPIKSRAAGASASGLPPAKKSWEILGERLLKATAL